MQADPRKAAGTGFSETRGKLGGKVDIYRGSGPLGLGSGFSGLL